MQSTSLRRVTVVGCGQIGTSIALALTRAGVEVALEDRDINRMMEAQLLGAGKELEPHAPPADLVVIAAPPADVVATLFDAQTRALGQAYTDVTEVKELIWAEAEIRGSDLMGYVPGHPVVDQELSDTTEARADLFVGRPWILCPYPTATALPEALQAVDELVRLCGGLRRDMAPEQHDAAVAAVCHSPQLVSFAVAAQFAHVDEDLLALVGEGLLDATRTADGDIRVVRDLFTQNPEAIAADIDRVAVELALVARELRDPRTEGSATLDQLLRRGAAGRQKLTTARGPDGYAAGMAAVEEVIAAIESGAGAGAYQDVDEVEGVREAGTDTDGGCAPTRSTDERSAGGAEQNTPSGGSTLPCADGTEYDAPRPGTATPSGQDTHRHREAG